jgi:hypothetical protein
MLSGGYDFVLVSSNTWFLLTLAVWVQSADIDRRILQETKAEQHIHKLLLLGNANLLELQSFFSSSCEVYLFCSFLA